MQRCSWTTNDPLYIEYHDTQWGVPVHDDRELFEMLLLEGVQAGLSWITVLKKREHYRRAMDGFDPERIAAYGEDKLEELLADPGLIRNRLKMRAAVTNAQAFLRVQREFGSFDHYIWQFVSGSPVQNRYASSSEVPARTEQSDAMSRDLKRRGFKFVGSTICYAYMQAAGMVNDHVTGCFRHAELSGGGR
ncbi:DNA-3-methyladenine glycosylase [Paenibacillus sp. J31TS4]|uniref:DNA-3-methyladenine glycosylase I n=1 Tax=Paenibacillus sp. J31TS4 TaxID=2807195 RepID=UPI001AFFF57E|nr:DNA-3-methyladenine glycosylase I [Paenibacillus sp. J31TS4]GIP40376.1 DNA-3-methyladenine glycosylase [Paenibacillus sp. J31TS4]